MNIKENKFKLVSVEPPSGQLYCGFLFILYSFLFLLIFLTAPEDYLKLGIPITLVAILVTGYFTVYFYNRYELKINSKHVEWYSEVLPGKVVQKWKENINSYPEISLIKITAHTAAKHKIAFSPDSIGYPMSKPSNSATTAGINNIEHLVVCLKHKSNPKRNVSLKHFVFEKETEWKPWLQNLSENIGLPINESITKVK